MRAILLILGLAVAPLAAAAQQAALIANVVRVEGDVLVAEGDVQVSYEGSILTATRVTYDKDTDQVAIVGPLTLTSDNGDTVLLADSAALDRDFTNGILQSARLVLDRQLQLAATEIARVDGRYTQLSNAVTSACRICATGATPLWEIRARKVIYDQQEELIYFDRASFRLAGVPIAYIPRLRLPSSNNPRQSGLLTPRLVTSSTLGFGIKLPYYQTLGPYADVTFTPYVSAETTTLEARYRQNFRTGAVDIAGAFSQDTILPDEDRYYLFAEGAFRLPGDFLLQFDLRETSDRRYLAQYDYSSIDLLESEVRVTRYDRNEAIRAAIIDYTPLAASEAQIADQLPGLAADFAYQRRLSVGGGELRLGIDAAGVQRDSDLDGLGRDVSEIGVSGDYIRRMVLSPGLVWTTRAVVSGGTYTVADDPAFDDVFRLAGGVSTELRLPLQRAGPRGSHHLIEPVVQLAWSGSEDRVPNEDSVLVDFDEGNLYAMNRFPGDDRVEEGIRANLGVGYTARLAEDQRLGLTLGRVIRDDPDPELNEGTGLAGTESDWLAALDLELARFDLAARTLVDDSFGATRAELIAGYDGQGFGLSGTYLFQDAEPLENRPVDTHQFDFAANARLARHWRGEAAGRYDMDTDGLDGASVGLTYQTECIRVGLDADRTFYRRLDIAPVTTYAVEVELLGFGAGSVDESYRSTCRG
ncbi:LPS-assembly protein LptD [Palleronia abyssalis]|uniref:LPS-assembly protein LptD n=1 Tax=Palleronia abyssalis TaxID=1501240 RepID=A0A2R8BV43_9RHOB|nr:LPS assembly protein LptD [Palleronia abyssalis]SPJ24031.1 LPS-assembly protein LptD [Palleronia abyssalis]